MRMMKRLFLVPLLMVSSACSLFGGSPDPFPAPLSPATVSVTTAAETDEQVTWDLTCVVPQSPIGGAITACAWNITVDGVALAAQPANGLTATLTIDKPEPGQTAQISATVRSVRRGLLSAASFTKNWEYTTPDVAPPAPTNIVVSYAVVGNEVQVNLTCVVPTGEQIETCNWTGTRKIGTATPVAVTIPAGLTTSFKIAKPEPAQTVDFTFTAVAVRRTLLSTPANGDGSYTQPDENPPAPTDIIFTVVGSGE